MSITFTGTDTSKLVTHAWLGTAEESASVEQVNGTTTRTNLIPNPSFETDLTGWSASSHTTLARDTTDAAFSGEASAKLTSTGGRNFISLTVPMSPGVDYTISAWVKLPAAAATPYGFNVEFYDANSTYLGEADSTVQVQGATDWARVSETFTAAAGTASAIVYPVISTGTAPSGEVVLVDAILLETGDALGNYFDGDTGSNFEPVLVQPVTYVNYSASRAGRHVYNAIVGGGLDVVATAANLRSGSLSIMFTNLQDAQALVDLISGTVPVVFDDSDVDGIGMTFMLNGDVSLTQSDEIVLEDGTIVIAYQVDVDFQEVSA